MKKLKGGIKGNASGFVWVCKIAHGRISCYEAVASHRSVIHIPDVWRCQTRRQENLHIASKRWTSTYPCCSFWERVVCNPRLREIRAYQWVDADHLYVARERTTRGARYQSTARCRNCGTGLMRNPKSETKFEKVKRSSPDCRKFKRCKVYIVSENIYCFKKQIFTIFYNISVWVSIRLFDFVSIWWRILRIKKLIIKKYRWDS